MNCSNCGRRLTEKTKRGPIKFCPFCGTEIRSSRATAFLKTTGRGSIMLYVSGETARSLLTKFPLGTEFSTMIEYGKTTYIALHPLNLPPKVEEVASTFPNVEVLPDQAKQVFSGIKEARDKDRQAERDR